MFADLWESQSLPKKSRMRRGVSKPIAREKKKKPTLVSNILCCRLFIIIPSPDWLAVALNESIMRFKELSFQGGFDGWRESLGKLAFANIAMQCTDSLNFNASK